MTQPKVRIIKPDGSREFVPVQDVAAEFAAYSILCANAYAATDAEPVAGSRLSDWTSAVGKLPISDKWSRCGRLEKFANDKQGSVDLAALDMQVWHRVALPSDPPVVVLVIRGTAQLSDWVSNLNWIGRRVPAIKDKYSRLRLVLSELIPQIKRAFPDAELVATGHSLGGGLAQFCAYANDGIKTVYAFDPSPVTGYFILPKSDRRRNKQRVVIHRINERGEILAFVRGPIRFLINLVRKVITPKADMVHVIEYRFNFEKGNFVKQHGMRALAWHLNHPDSGGDEAHQTT